MNDMSVEEFDIALHAGLGRCVQFLDGCADKEPYREAVLQACLNDYGYDGQSEGSRAWYTYRLLSCFNDDEYFYSRTFEKLASVFDGKERVWEFEYLFNLVLQFAINGYAAAKTVVQKLYKALLEWLAVNTPNPRLVDYDLQWLEHICIEGVKLGGIDAFVKIAADLGELFEKTSAYNAESFDQFVFVNDCRFGRDKIIVALNAVSDPDGHIAAYMQSVEQHIISVGSPSKELTQFIVKMRDKREKELTCDVNKIMRDIKRYDNTEKNGKWHGVASNIVKNVNTVFPIEAYMYVYTGLCACCRNRVVRAMHKHGLLTDELLRECEFDCYADTREFAGKILRGE